MLKKWYYFLIAPIFCLFFTVPAYAAQSSHTVNFTDSDGLTLNVRYQDHSAIAPSGYYEEHDNNGAVTGYTYNWDISENIDLILTQGKYYSGYVNVKLTWTANPASDLVSATINNTNATNGIYVYVSTISSNYIQLQWVFDNYYTASASTLGTASLDLKFAYRGSVSQSQTYLNVTFTPTVSRNLHGYGSVQNNALTAMIYNAIYQGVGPDMQTIVNLLTGIRNQDYTYYNSIINELSQLHTDNLANYNQLIAILNELDTDFTDVQTVLDLFPSYRTQVLQYWQDLLAMNAAQSSAAAEIESQYQDKENQSESLSNSMNNVNMPTLSANDIDILGSVDTNSKTNFFGLIALITHHELITKIMLIIVTGSLVGYILFGKKG